MNQKDVMKALGIEPETFAPMRAAGTEGGAVSCETCRRPGLCCQETDAMDDEITRLRGEVERLTADRHARDIAVVKAALEVVKEHARAQIAKWADEANNGDNKEEDRSVARMFWLASQYYLGDIRAFDPEAVLKGMEEGR